MKLKDLLKKNDKRVRTDPTTGLPHLVTREAGDGRCKECRKKSYDCRCRKP